MNTHLTSTSLKASGFYGEGNKLSALAGLQGFLQAGAGQSIDVEVRGSSDRPRYSQKVAQWFNAACDKIRDVAKVALVSGVVGMTALAGAHADTNAAGSVAASVMSVSVADQTFDSTLSTSSRAELGAYKIVKHEANAANAVKKRFSTAEVDSVMVRTSVAMIEKETCTINLVPFANGHLLPDSMMKAQAEWSPAEIEQAKKMMDKFVFIHEDSHCDAVSWIESERMGLSSDKALFNQAIEQFSDVLIKQSRNLHLKITSNGRGNGIVPSIESVLKKSPQEFAATLMDERYADARAALELGRDMLTKGMGISAYNNAMQMVVNLREMESEYARSSRTLSDHDTLTTLRASIQMVQDAYANGDKGMKALFGDAANGSATEEQVQAWHDHSADVARLLTIASLKTDQNQLMEDFEEKVTQRYASASVANGEAAKAAVNLAAANAAVANNARNFVSTDFQQSVAKTSKAISAVKFIPPPPVSVRIDLCKQAVKDVGLEKMGLSWKHVYGIVQAETGWIARDGMGLNGKVSRGLAQLEDDTAKSLGIQDPNDPRQALKAVALLAKEAAFWAKSKGLDPGGPALSLYYNLSTSARNKYAESLREQGGLNVSAISDLPTPTLHHIKNRAEGFKVAGFLEGQVRKDLANKDKLHQPYVSRLSEQGRMLSINQQGQNASSGGAASYSVLEIMGQKILSMRDELANGVGYSESNSYPKPSAG